MNIKYLACGGNFQRIMLFTYVAFLGCVLIAQASENFSISLQTGANPDVIVCQGDKITLESNYISDWTKKEKTAGSRQLIGTATSLSEIAACPSGSISCDYEYTATKPPLAAPAPAPVNPDTKTVNIKIRPPYTFTFTDQNGNSYGKDGYNRIPKNGVIELKAEGGSAETNYVWYKENDKGGWDKKAEGKTFVMPTGNELFKIKLEASSTESNCKTFQTITFNSAPSDDKRIRYLILGGTEYSRSHANFSESTSYLQLSMNRLWGKINDKGKYVDGFFFNLLTNSFTDVMLSQVAAPAQTSGGSASSATAPKQVFSATVGVESRFFVSPAENIGDTTLFSSVIFKLGAHDLSDGQGQIADNIVHFMGCGFRFGAYKDWRNSPHTNPMLNSYFDIIYSTYDEFRHGDNRVMVEGFFVPDEYPLFLSMKGNFTTGTRDISTPADDITFRVGLQITSDGLAKFGKMISAANSAY